MTEIFTQEIIISILVATIRIASPLIIAALGELVVERSGVINLGVEGMMLIGAFAGYYLTLVTGSPYAGIVAGVLAGILVSIILAVCAITLKLEQFVTGMALNILGGGLTLFWYRSIQQSLRNENPTITLLGKLEIPFLSKIPWIGDIFFSQNLLTYFTFLMVPLIWFFLYRTKYGLELRCLGENPAAIDMKGLSVDRRQYAAVLFGGLMAGLAGAFVSVCSSTRFVPNMTGGRGWLAIVIVIAGNWRPTWIMVAALIFAFLDAFQLHVQAIGIKFPYQILLALPYIVAVLAMMFSKAKTQMPAALGIPYRRE